MDNRSVHGHIHNYKDFTLVHGHLHSKKQDIIDDPYKHFEFINLNKTPQELPKASSDSEYPSLKMLMEECHCDPQIIEICCDNTSHNTLQPMDCQSDIEPIAKKQKISTNQELIYSPKDLLFLDNCNTENKQTSKDVLMNFLDISKMYDIPVLNKTHGKIVHQENLLDVGFTKKDQPVIQNHHHHKLELHSHRMHNQVKKETVDDIINKVDQEKHSLDCHFDCEDPIAESFKVKKEDEQNHLDFKWNDFVTADTTNTQKCKWENCDKSFSSLMELHSHLIFDHLQNSKKIGSHDIDMKQNEEERCFWDNCDFEYHNDGDMINHINDSHGIQFNIEMNPIPDKVIKLPPVSIEHTCKWDNCGLSFKTEEELDKHIAMHVPTRQAEYVCCWSECGKFFKQRQKLLRHLKSHSKYKGSVCDLCKKTFSTSDGLLYHKKKMHSTDGDKAQVEQNISQ